MSVVTLLTTAPGCSTLWAEGPAVFTAPSGTAVVPTVPTNPLARQIPGGPSNFKVPAGWTQTDSGLWVPPGFHHKSAAVAGDAQAAPQEALPADAVLSRKEILDDAKGLDSANLEQSSGDQAYGGGEKLQATLERRVAPTLPQVEVAGSYAAVTSLRPSSALRAPSPLRGEGRRAGNGILAPKPGTAADRPDTVRMALVEASVWARAFKYYYLDVAVHNWAKYKGAREAAALAARPEPDGSVSDTRGLFGDLQSFDLPVADARNFFTDARLMGMIGGPRTIRTISGSDAYVVAEAREVFNRYFDHPGITQQARVAFEVYLQRATVYNPKRRSSNLRKHIRKALLSASTLPPERLPAFFESLFSENLNTAVAEYQSEDQATTLAQFRAAVEETIAQETPLERDPARRVVAVVLLGSFASQAATPTSDFDLQVITADGSSKRVPAFLERLSARWSSMTHPINGAPFGLPPSRGLLMRMHGEPYMILSPDRALERNLSPPEGYYKESARPEAPTRFERLQTAAYRGILSAALWWSDVKDLLKQPAPAESSLTPAARNKALIGWLAGRSVFLSAFILTGLVAYPLFARALVGNSGYGTLMAVGSMMSIVLGSASGVLIDRLSYRNAAAMNTFVRAVVSLALPALLYLGVLTIDPHQALRTLGSMMLVSLVNGWNISSSLIAESKLLPAIAGPDAKDPTKPDARRLAGINALAYLNFFGLNVLLGIFLSGGRFVDMLVAHFGQLNGLSAAFLLSAVANFPVAFLIQWFTFPNVKPASKAAQGPAPAKRFTARNVAVWAGLIGFGVWSYLHWQTTIFLVASILAGLAVTSEGLHKLWKNKTVRWAAVLGMVLSALYYPFQSMAIPFMAGDLKGGAVLQSQMVGSLFFGQLLASSVRLNLPGKWNYAVQGGVLAAMATWLYFYLFPHNLGALAVGMALASILYVGVSSLTDKGWLKFQGFGLAFIALPIALWGNPSFLFVSILMIGLFVGPNMITLDSVIQKEAKEADPANAGRVIGARSALINAATALGYASMDVVTHKWGFGFPPALWFIAGAFGIAAVVFWKAPSLLKRRLAPEVFQWPAWLKRWMPWQKGPQTPEPPVGLALRRAFAAAGVLALGTRIAAPALTDAQTYTALAARAQGQGIKVIVTDYDGTLMDKTPDDKAVPASDALVEALTKLRRETGVQLVVSTNHFFDGDGNAMTALLGDRLPPDVRAGMLFVVQSGAVIYQYGPNGEKPAAPLWQETPFDADEQAAVTQAFDKAAAEAGLKPGDYKIVNESSRSLIELHKKDGAEAALAALEEAVVRNNPKGYLVQNKGMVTMRKVPYIQYFKAHKGTGAAKAMALLKERGLVSDESQAVILGDDFKTGGNDLYMAQALPGALAVSVGKRSDARQDNVLQMETRGSSSTLGVLRELHRLSVLGPKQP